MLDRDGTIIRERHYLSDPDDVELLPGAAEGLLALQRLGFGLVVLTNQSGIGRGYFDIACLDVIHDRMKTLLANAGVQLDGIYYCEHTPEDNCSCRKPKPGLVELASSQLGFRPSDAIMVGDKAIDCQLGRAVGAQTFLVLTGYGEQEREASADYADNVAADLVDVAKTVAAQRGEIIHGSDFAKNEERLRRK